MEMCEEINLHSRFRPISAGLAYVDCVRPQHGAMYQLIIVCACCPTLHQWGLSGYRKGIFMSSLTIVCVYGCSECVSQSGSGRPFQLMECGAYIMARVVE